MAGIFGSQKTFNPYAGVGAPGYDIWTQWGGNGGGIYNPNMGQLGDGAPAQAPMSAARPVQSPTLDMALPTDPYANERPAEAPGLFGKGRKLRDFVGYGLGAFAEALGGGENPYRVAMDEDRRAKNELVRAQMLARLKEQEQLRQWQLEQSKPQFANIGKSWARYDPLTGQTEQLFRAPSEEVQFATDLNLSPGTKEYAQAVRDRALGAQGPSAMAMRLKELQDQAARGWAGIAETRRHNRVSEAQGDTRLSQTSPSDVVGPIMAKMSRGEPLSQGEQAALDRYRSFDPFNAMMANMLGGASQPPATASPAPTAPPPRAQSGPRVGQTATNPKTGRRIRWDGKRWQPIN